MSISFIVNCVPNSYISCFSPLQPTSFSFVLIGSNVCLGCSYDRTCSRDANCVIIISLNRHYYRCTHRHSQGCCATKQVQKNDEGNTYSILYLGLHSCSTGIIACKIYVFCFLLSMPIDLLRTFISLKSQDSQEIDCNRATIK